MAVTLPCTKSETNVLICKSKQQVTVILVDGVSSNYVDSIVCIRCEVHQLGIHARTEKPCTSSWSAILV